MAQEGGRQLRSVLIPTRAQRTKPDPRPTLASKERRQRSRDATTNQYQQSSPQEHADQSLSTGLHLPPRREGEGAGAPPAKAGTLPARCFRGPALSPKERKQGIQVGSNQARISPCKILPRNACPSARAYS